MKQKLTFAFIILVFYATGLKAQSAGESTYSFLRLPVSARASALGGEAIGLWDNDAGLVLQSPSLLTASMNKQATLAFISYYADIKYGSIGLVRDFGKFGTMAFGLSGINYGSFQAADELGNITGTFRASEYNMNVSLARALSPRVQMGTSFKPVYSAMESYVSYGFAFDMGFTYHSADSLFAATAMFRNFGTQLKTYAGSHEPLPFEILAGFSLKMRHAPFRIVTTFEQLQDINVFYKRPTTNNDPFAADQASSTSQSSLSHFGNEILSHTVAGIEFNPLRGFYLRGGYSFRRRNELKVVDKPAMVGFSWGFGLKIRRLMFNYARSTYHISGASNVFSVSIDLTTRG
ncbi:MAG TPA: type IX secretion system protein PorQ [Williamwhitmania sp.]|nr:type IX secretion system protein PorQ [Williamwhitmania sp.]